MKNSTQKKAVYLVDDHPLLRESMANLINRQPDLYVCGESESADCALPVILDLQPDLAIVDLSLGKGSGLELIERLKARRSAASIIVLSMHDEAIYAERCIRAGAAAYIMKRESSIRIIKAIRQVLSSQLYVSDKVVALFTGRLSEARGTMGPRPIGSLSQRELLVFKLLGDGMPPRQVAEKMNISVKTVHTYCDRIKNKLRLSNSNDLVCEAIYWRGRDKDSVGA